MPRPTATDGCLAMLTVIDALAAALEKQARDQGDLLPFSLSEVLKDRKDELISACLSELTI